MSESMMSTPTCVTCPHWQRGLGLGQGTCHRHAPSPSLVVLADPGQLVGLTTLLVWPQTKSEDFCAEHPTTVLAMMKALTETPAEPVPNLAGASTE